MARDRKRAKQRRARGARSSAPPPTQPIRRDLPGALDHASSDVDEFDAAILQGAHGVPISSEALEEEIAEQSDAGSGSGGGPPQKPGSGDGGDGGDGEEGPVAHPSVPPQHQGNRAFAFLRSSWAELQRVQWPDRPQVTQATTVVLGFVVIAGAYLGAADWVAQKLVNLIL